MPQPMPTSAIRRLSRLSLCLGGFALLLVVFVAKLHARGPDPPQRIALEPFGFQNISNRYLLEGATMLTLDYVDNQHLLVTFGISRLMNRLADCPSEDEDRIVKAVLIELPTGRELASTEWRFHDLGQYLWDLGGGHFLLRQRNTLTTLSPLENLSAGQSFAQQPFLKYDRQIQAIVISADRELLSIESIRRGPPRPDSVPVAQVSSQASSVPNSSGQAPGPVPGLKRRDPNEPKPDRARPPTQVDFVRVLRSNSLPPARHGDIHPQPNTPPQGPEHTRIVGRVDGRIFTSTTVNVPLTTAGFLRSRASTRDGVMLDFLTFSGKDVDLGDFATTCPPQPTFVSPSEFVAFGCRGDTQSLDLAGFNLKGDFLWQINFTDEQAYPGFVSAIPVGRFAFSRTVTSTHVFGNETPSMDQLQAQEVRVIQTYNGKQLLRVVTSPIQRAGQNFTLSPDGLSLAVIHDNPTVKSNVVTHHTSIEIYALPPLSNTDQAQIKLEAALAPPPSDVHFAFSPEEIKAAIAAKPDTTNSAPPNPNAATPADSRIAGDPAPPTPTQTSGTGTIPASDTPAACANLVDTSATPAACPVNPLAKTPPAKPETDSESAPAKPRKPPTLYEPAPADSSSPAPK